MEKTSATAAAYTAYADHEIGRVIQEIEVDGKLDNTPIIYIVGDNGTNPEGTLLGTPWPDGAKPGGNMLRVFAAANLSLFLFGSGAALADDCSPHCDYWHYYGPFDFSYTRPGLVGYPICDQRGNCSPHLVYTYSGRQHGRLTITVRPLSKTMRNARGGS